MAFLIYQKEQRDNKTLYINRQQNYKLGGYGLIYSLWKKRGMPLNQGWSVNVNDLLQEYNENYNDKNHSLLIDFHPSSKNRIGIIEIEHIHLYTFGENMTAYWTPMMLELRDVFYKENYENLSNGEKKRIISEIEVYAERQKIIEFLYLQGNWNWGRNGSTNAAFIHDEPRKYFKKFF